MRTNGVLVLGLNRNRELTEALFDAGLAPVVRETIEGALKKLRREEFEAVILDRANADVDALEFILNVRDMDTAIPIIVVGGSPEPIPFDTLLSRENTRVLQGPIHVEELVEELSKMETRQATGEA